MLRKRISLLLAVFMLPMTGACAAYDDFGSIVRGYHTLLGDVRATLLEDLSMGNALPDRQSASWEKSKTMIYILGGTQDSLKNHFQIAAGLYNKGIADKVYILARPGITEYNPALSRNLTNDEWSIRELGELGVKSKDIESVSVPQHFFGTYSEALGISRLARQRGYRRLILVSSIYHTRRVHLAFSHFLDGAVEIYVAGSRDPAGLGALLVEYAKYLGYREILIPVIRRFGNGSSPLTW